MPCLDRWLAVVLMMAALAATSQIIHHLMATTMMGLMFAVYSIPVLSLSFVIWALTCRCLSNVPRHFNNRFNEKTRNSNVILPVCHIITHGSCIEK